MRKLMLRVGPAISKIQKKWLARIHMHPRARACTRVRTRALGCTHTHIQAHHYSKMADKIDFMLRCVSACVCVRVGVCVCV